MIRIAAWFRRTRLAHDLEQGRYADHALVFALEPPERAHGFDPYGLFFVGQREALARPRADAVEGRRVFGPFLDEPQHSSLWAGDHFCTSACARNPDIPSIADIQATPSWARQRMPCKSPLTDRGPLLECRPRAS